MIGGIRTKAFRSRVRSELRGSALAQGNRKADGTIPRKRPDECGQGIRRSQRQGKRSAQGILCPTYNSIMQILPRAVARGLLFAAPSAVVLYGVGHSNRQQNSGIGISAEYCSIAQSVPFRTPARSGETHGSKHCLRDTLRLCRAPIEAPAKNKVFLRDCSHSAVSGVHCTFFQYRAQMPSRISLSPSRT